MITMANILEMNSMSESLAVAKPTCTLALPLWLASLAIALYRGSQRWEGKREAGTDRLRMRLINSNFCRL